MSMESMAPSTGPARMLMNASQQKANARQPAETIVERVGDREFQLDIRGFWQVHRQGAELLSQVVGQTIDESLFDVNAANLDLYGGVGLFAASMGDRFGAGVR